MFIGNVAAKAEFGESKMGKVSLASGDHLYAGLNCFLPGQEHTAHIHAGQDKMYIVIEGQGEASAGGDIHPVSPGDMVFAPAGIIHGMKNTGDANLIVLVVFSPPPSKK